MSATLVIKFSEILANDVGEGISIVSIGVPTNGGTAVLNSEAKTITYTAPEVGNFDTFTYKISDRLKQTSIATINISISGESPMDREITLTYPDYPGLIIIPVDRFLPEGSGSTVRLTYVGPSVVNQTKGTVFFQAGEDIRYFVPDDHTQGGGDVITDDYLSYTFSDSSGTSLTRELHLILKDSPSAIDDNLVLPARNSADFASQVQIYNYTLLGNDLGRNLSVSGFTQPKFGTITPMTNGQGIIYTRPADPTPVDTFTYTISNLKGEVSTAKVTLSETSDEAAGFPIARDDIIPLSGSSAFAEPIRVQIITLLGNDTYDGSVNVAFSPSPNGAESYKDGDDFVYIPTTPPRDDLITYTITNSLGRQSSARVLFKAPTNAPTNQYGRFKQICTGLISDARLVNVTLDAPPTVGNILVAIAITYQGAPNTRFDWTGIDLKNSVFNFNLGAVTTAYKVVTSEDTTDRRTIPFVNSAGTTGYIGVFEFSGNPANLSGLFVDSTNATTYTHQETPPTNGAVIGIAMSPAGAGPSVSGDGVETGPRVFDDRTGIYPFYAEAAASVIAEAPPSTGKVLVYASMSVVFG